MPGASRGCTGAAKVGCAGGEDGSGRDVLPPTSKAVNVEPDIDPKDLMAMSPRPKLLKMVSAAALALAAFLLSGCNMEPPPERCRIEGPNHLIPGGVRVLRLGMTRDKVESILSEPVAYSPSEGQYYYSTGGDCPLGDSGRVAPCGVVAEFRAVEPESGTRETMQSCRWGALGE